MANEFATLDIGYLHYTTYVRVRVITNSLAHLTCWHTDKTPVRHKMSRTLRGLIVPQGAYWCFVAAKSVDQDEAGDTLIHTFTIPDWSYCQTRFLVFTGTISGIESPSISPYFKHHHNNWPPASFILRPISAGIDCRIFNGVPYACPDHWANVDDITPDEDASNVNSSWVATTFYQRDLYTIGELTTYPTLISNIQLVLRLRRQGGFAFVPLARHYLYYTGNYDMSPSFNIPNTAYANFSRSYATNPFTTQPWTYSDLPILQAGLGIRSYWGVGWASYALCTQVYLQVNLDFLI